MNVEADFWPFTRNKSDRLLVGTTRLHTFAVCITIINTVKPHRSVYTAIGLCSCLQPFRKIVVTYVLL